MKSRTIANGHPWKNFPHARPAHRNMRIPVAGATMPRRLPAAPAARKSNCPITRETRLKAWIQSGRQPELLDAGRILAMRGVGGFHLACIEDSADELKHRLGRIEQPFAIMVRPDYIDRLAIISRTGKNRSWKARFIPSLS